MQKKRISTHSLSLFILIAIFTFQGCSHAPHQTIVSREEFKNPTTTAAISDEHARFRPVVGTRGMVVSDDAIASEWGVEILRRGGNAIDAAVATAFMLSVTRPHYGSLGGGGFMLYCPKSSRGTPARCEVLDYRERAPFAAHRNMYLIDGKARSDLAQDSAMAPGTPGVVAGLLGALEKWGTKSRIELLARPIQIARGGFPFSSYTERVARDRWSVFNAEAKHLMSCGSGRDEPCRPGQIFRQKALADVLLEISHKGIDGFYSGWVAKKIVEGLKKDGGILSLDDFARYSVSFRAPVHGNFGGFDVVSMPPPSAGGTVLLQMLTYADLANDQGAFKLGYGSVPSIHALTHAMALAYYDRAELFGDPDFVSVPLDRLLSESYLKKRFQKTYRPDRANIPEMKPTQDPNRFAFNESDETTHFSVVDAEGNAVAVTTTVNHNFGSGQVPPGTGIFMNNEMDDFAIQPGTANSFGLVQGEQNAIAPQKRPLSSMTPTIVRDKQGNNRIVLGAAGGPKITTSVFLTLINRLLFGMSITDAVNAPRFHHQWRPATLMVERFGFAPEVRAGLAEMGYEVQSITESARMHVLERFTDGRTVGAPDRRAEGAAVAE